MKNNFVQYTLRVPKDVDKIIQEEKKKRFLEDNELLSDNQILIKIIRAYSNGRNPKSVSNPPIKLVSEQKNKENPIQVPETVPENVSNNIWDSDFLESLTDK